MLYIVTSNCNFILKVSPILIVVIDDTVLISPLSNFSDPRCERPTSDTYIPRDENFGHLKSSDFLTYAIKSLTQNVLPQFNTAFGFNNEFDSFEDVRCLFDGGVYLPTDVLSKISPIPVLKEIFRTDGEQALKFPPPHVIKGIVYIVISYFFFTSKITSQC